MALVIPSASPALSGSIGGTTYAHNRGGQYARARRTPTNPNTVLQIAVRTIFAQLSAAWGLMELTPRQDWEYFATQVPVTNRVGIPINIGGIGWFQKVNVPRLQAAINDPTILSIDVAPEIFTLPTVALATPGLTAPDTGQLVITGPLDPDVFLPGGFANVYLSGQKSPGTNFFKGPYQLAHTHQFAAGNSTLSSMTLTFPLDTVAGGGDLTDNKQYGRLVIQAADGRPAAVQDFVLNA